MENLASSAAISGNMKVAAWSPGHSDFRIYTRGVEG